LKAIKLLVLELIIIFFLSGCKEEAPNNIQTLSITGKWNGTGNSSVMNLDLVQNEYNVSGIGTWIVDSKTYELQIVGWCNYPNISLTLTTPGLSGTISYSGQFVSSEKHKGKINSPTMTDIDFEFVRQK
jgi:hypothetical protein